MLGMEPPDEELVHVASWERTLLMVARQEMEHLGLVGNLVTALGGTLWLGRPRFPYATHLFGHTRRLERFSEEAVKKFVCFERPEDIDIAQADASRQQAAEEMRHSVTVEDAERARLAMLTALTRMRIAERARTRRG